MSNELIGRLAGVGLLLAAAGGCAAPAEDGDTAATTAVAGHPGAPASQSVNATPEQLLGLAPEELKQMLGPADFRRSDGPAEIWQFRDVHCVLDVFFYADPSAGSYRVQHVEARDRSLVRTAEQTCVAGLLRQRRLRAAS